METENGQTFESPGDIAEPRLALGWSGLAIEHEAAGRR
jgi:hypothetical protein